jgi:O-antigen ligase
VSGLWLARGLTRQSGVFITTPIGGFVLAFIILAVFSFVAGMQYAGLRMDTVRHFAEILIAIAFFFVVVNVVRDRATLGRVVTAIIVAGFVSALIGIVLYFLPHETTIRVLSSLRVFHYPTGEDVLRFVEDNPDNPLRAISTSIDPNVLGGLLILVTALTTPQIFADKPLLPRKFIVPMWLTMVICLILTFSRGALLGLGVAMVLVAVARYRKLLIVMAIGAVLMLVLPQTQNYILHFQEGLSASDKATLMRFGEYKDAFILILRNPIFGVGFLGTPDVDTYIGVSSVYLLMAEEMGLVGLSVFLLTTGAYYWHALSAWLRGMAHDAYLAPILLGLTAALVGAMVGGVLDHYFFNLDFPHSVTLFWLFVGLGLAVTNVERTSEQR